MLNWQDTHLALIHIPLGLYTLFLQPILQLLLPEDADEARFGESTSQLPRRRSWAYVEPFVNISITPIECSVSCSRALCEELFLPAVESLDASLREQVSISKDDYVVMQVDGEGLDAGQRVLELTSPLAMAGMYVRSFTSWKSF